MKFSLDTNFCIAYLNGRSPRAVERLRAQAIEDIGACSVVRAELYYGAAKSQRTAHTLAGYQFFLKPHRDIEFNDRAALIFGEIRSDLERQGKPIGPYDMQIAAIALASDLTLVTQNTREFSRDSRIENGGLAVGGAA